MESKNGGITAVKGFEAAGVEAGIKYHNRKDMAIIYSERPCVTAGVFTSNVVKAAPVLWDKELIDTYEKAHAVIINAGIANACTGEQGEDYCRQTAAEAAQVLGVKTQEVLVASTGVIGMQLPFDKIKDGIQKLAGEKNSSLAAGQQAAEAIMTTDTVSKQAAVSVVIDGREVTIGGICKGSGMIHPNMGTMLAFVATDAAISKELLQEALKQDVQNTFNMVSVDGDTSTNDTLIVLANGAAGNQEITVKEEDYRLFCQALHEVNEALSRKIAGDGEGATALFETKVVRAANKEEARKLAKAVICSSLTKAAIFGHDANWGRILCALGYSGVTFNPAAIELTFQSAAGSILIYKNGCAADYSEEEATRILSEPEVTVLVDMKKGVAQATAWGCDLTYDYVKINADYRS